MTRFVQAEFPVQHGGLLRVIRGFEALGSFSITRSVLQGLAILGSPVTRVSAKVSASFAAVRAARRQRREDDKLWSIALTDARVMADLSRAMSRDALRDTRAYI